MWSMFKKLQKILLVDDSESDNYIHARKIAKADVTDEIIVKYSGIEALDYLCNKNSEEDYPRPQLIFLDINMPGMNGWEFMEAYDQIEEKMKANVVITMLTTSIADSDKELAMKRSDINAYENKPLTEKKLWNILEKFFPERFVDENK